MNINIKSTKIELTPNIRGYIQDKVDMLEKYLGNVSVSNCDFEVERAMSGQNKGEIFRAEINLCLPGELIRIEKTEKDLYKAIDKVKDHAARSIKQFKEIRQDKKRQSGE